MLSIFRKQKSLSEENIRNMFKEEFTKALTAFAMREDSMAKRLNNLEKIGFSNTILEDINNKLKHIENTMIRIKNNNI